MFDRASAWHARLDRLLPAVFAAYAGPLVLLLALFVPALQVADESYHFARADQISGGELLTWRQNSDAAGGHVDAGIFAVAALYAARLAEPNGRIDADLIRKARRIDWAKERHFMPLHGVGAYPPFLYGAPVLAVWTGRTLGLSISDTALLSRLFNGLVAISLSVAALALMPHGRAAMFTILALPMTLQQFASASQDAMLISLGALFVAIVARALAARRPLRSAELIGAVLIATLLSLARPPMFPMMLVLLIPGLASPGRWPLRGVAILAALTLIVAAWVAYSSTNTIATYGHMRIPISPSWQFEILLDRPFSFVGIVGETWRISGDNLMRHFIGVLGSLQVVLPETYYDFMYVVLALGFLGAAFDRGGPPWQGSAVILAAVAATVLAMLIALYLTWTPLGWNYVEGPQGRYFLPLALLLSAAVPALARRKSVLAAITCIAVAAPMVTMSVVPAAVVDRYYAWGG